MIRYSYKSHSFLKQQRVKRSHFVDLLTGVLSTRVENRVNVGDKYKLWDER